MPRRLLVGFCLSLALAALAGLATRTSLGATGTRPCICHFDQGQDQTVEGSAQGRAMSIDPDDLSDHVGNHRLDRILTYTNDDEAGRRACRELSPCSP